MARMVQCVKIGQLLPGLEQPPFPGELGERIHEHVSAQGYEMWHPYATMLINHYGLSLGNPQHRDYLMDQMEEFFFGQSVQPIEGWAAPGQAGAKGGGAPSAKGGAPAAKGGGAPRRK
jgi:Fe-S cluster biosynthesis and repair protein YggX